MVGGRLGERSGISEEILVIAASLAVKSHERSNGFIKETLNNNSDEQVVVFAFCGSWSVQDFYSHEPFGEININSSLFPSLKCIRNDDPATVNGGFFKAFLSLLHSTSLQAEVERAVNKVKVVVFTGHSSGGPLAIFVALWYLEKYVRPGTAAVPPRCLTFGSPLIGNHIFSHAVNRENWARYFLHFVGRYDIVPRITLSPLSPLKQELGQILNFCKFKSLNFQQPPKPTSYEASTFFKVVLKNSLSVASHAACKLMGSTNSFLEAMSSFVKLSPYRPSGTFIFCTGKGKLVVVENPNAVLQIMFYSCRPSSEAQLTEAAYRSLHTAYEDELKESLLEGMQDVVYLDDLVEIPLSSNGNISGDKSTINSALNDLGLSTRARLCLRAAQEFEKQKLRNQEMIDDYISGIKGIEGIKDLLDEIVDYQKVCNDRKIGYYDAFKIQKVYEDFNANIKRVKLAKIWDIIVEMLNRSDLPDGFESRREWIVLGTTYRRLVEPLEIANYYRLSKNEDTGTYLRDGGRSKRYKYTQRWREHAEMLREGSSSESIFWAKVEELRRKPFEEVKEHVFTLERELRDWIQKDELGEDVFSEKSTFVEWWKTLPERHKSESCLKWYMRNF